jgi:hypothetical protein
MSITDERAENQTDYLTSKQKYEEIYGERREM